MKVETVSLGVIEIEEEKVIQFNQGIPGFEDLTSFTIINLDQEFPIFVLQSLEVSEISFLIGDPFYFFPEYEWELPESVQKELLITDPSEVTILCIITTPSDISQATINLLAPIVLNHEKRIGKQHILHASNYNTRHPLVRNRVDSRTKE